MSTSSQFGGGIKGIQRGTITITTGTTNTATITTVDTTKTELRMLGSTCDGTASISESLARIALTNSTTITATRGSGGNTTVISWELTEFY